MRTKQTYIIGTGGFGKEILFLIEDINQHSKQFHFKGFIDKANIKKVFNVGGREYKVFQEDDFLIQNENRKDDIFLIIAIGDPKRLKKVSKKFKDFFFPNLIHPSFIGDIKGIKLGNGNIIAAGCIFTTDIQIGNFNLFNRNVMVGHDCIIGDCNVINPMVNISGGVEVGDANLIGAGATILQYLKIRSESILGAASLLTKNLSNGKLAMGVPAKVVRDLS